MRSLKELYRIGMGPSSSHTMAPKRAAEIFRKQNPQALSWRASLYGSLAATGVGHLTDVAIRQAFEPDTIEIIFKQQQTLPEHPNGMLFESLDETGNVIKKWEVYSTGGGALNIDNDKTGHVYNMNTMDKFLSWTEETGKPLWKIAEECEPEIYDYLLEVWRTMKSALNDGLSYEGVLPGGLNLSRKAHAYLLKTKSLNEAARRTGLLSAYALAVAEENAGGGIIVTAPTCGSCGVLPAVLFHLHNNMDLSEPDIIHALATAGLVGNIVKTNSSISGAEVGCQGEIGTACAMASAAAAQLLGGSPHQIEYAAEMGLEHHLGLTCDPVAGLVQIPCIERNAMAATRAMDCAEYALLSDGRHRISFDQVVQTMKETGTDMLSLYRETSEGGLASVYKRKKQ